MTDETQREDPTGTHVRINIKIIDRNGKIMNYWDVWPEKDSLLNRDNLILIVWEEFSETLDGVGFNDPIYINLGNCISIEITRSD